MQQTQAVVQHYATLRLGRDFITTVREQLEEAVADDQSNVRDMHAALNRRLRELDEKEARLIDLAADATLPQAKIRAKLHEVQRDRERVQAGLASTSEQLAVGATVLRDALHLVEDPQSLYRQVENKVRRHLNDTFFERLYLDELIVASDEKKPLFAELNKAAAAYQQNAPYPKEQDSPHEVEAVSSSSTDLLTLSDHFSVKVSSKPVIGRAGGARTRDQGIMSPRL